VSAAIALIAVTGMHAICAGLERMRVPKVFVVQLMFLYRYLFVLVEEAASMARARAFRSANKRGRGLRSFGPLIGHLLLRTTDRARRIHLAMISRGFTGEIKLIKPLHIGFRDLAFAAGWLAFLIFLRMVNTAHLFGELMLGVVQLATTS
jgi:cobalt/nickel transport system permease protein